MTDFWLRSCVGRKSSSSERLTSSIHRFRTCAFIWAGVCVRISFIPKSRLYLNICRTSTTPPTPPVLGIIINEDVTNGINAVLLKDSLLRCVFSFLQHLRCSKAGGGGGGGSSSLYRKRYLGIFPGKESLDWNCNSFDGISAEEKSNFLVMVILKFYFFSAAIRLLRCT